MSARARTAIMRRASRGVRQNRRILFKTVTYHDNNVDISLQDRELTQWYKALAKANGHAYSDLVANDEIFPTVPLECRIIDRFPVGSGFLDRAGGYIVAKIRGSSTAVGHSFWGDGTSEATDPDCPPPRRKTGEIPEPASPRRAPPRVSRPTSMAEAPLTPNSREGDVSPMLIRLHRAAAMAATATPEMDSKQWGVLHICGNKNCGVVGHFRPGTRMDNEADEKHHLKHPGTSRKRYRPWQ